MSEEVKETTTPELEVNNVVNLEEKLAAAIENNPNKPTEEEIQEAQDKFEESSKNFAVKSWNIGEAENAQEFLDYINHFMRNRVFWTKNGWMGVLKMQAELDDAQKFLTANPKEHLKLGYQALEFAFYSFQNPGGVGLDAAKDFEQENEIYAKVFDALGDPLDSARKELKEIQFMQDQYAAMQQGFYLEAEDGVAEEEPVPGETPAQEEVAEE